MDEVRSVKTQIELQEAQAEIMEALSVIQQASQSKENLVTQIDLKNLKKELSTDLKNELVDEIRTIYEEIAKISITPLNITQELHSFSTNLKKEIAEQLKGSREEVVKNNIQINKNIASLSKKYSTLDSKVNEVSSEAKGEMSVQMIDLKSKLENMEEAVDRQRIETREQIGYLSEDVVHKLVVNTQVLNEQKRNLDERINLCKKEMTSEMVEKQSEIQDVLFGLAVAITEPEGKIHNKNGDTNSKQATSNNRLLEVINNWGTTHQPNKTSMAVTSTPKIRDDSFFNAYSVIQQYQADKQPINEEDKSKNKSYDSSNRSRGRYKSGREDNTVTQKVKSFN